MATAGPYCVPAERRAREVMLVSYAGLLRFLVAASVQWCGTSPGETK